MVKSHQKEPINILFGPPQSKEDTNKVLSLFFSCSGRHIVCGGTTASIVSAYLEKTLVTSLCYEDEDVPPIAAIEGVDLVTEGVVTMQKVVLYAKDYLLNGRCCGEWKHKKDGASEICRLLFEVGTDIRFFVGKAVNPAHQGLHSPIGFHVKMALVEQLVKQLEQMGKRVEVTYF